MCRNINGKVICFSGSGERGMTRGMTDLRTAKIGIRKWFKKFTWMVDS